MMPAYGHPATILPKIRISIACVVTASRTTVSTANADRIRLIFGQRFRIDLKVSARSLVQHQPQVITPMSLAWMLLKLKV
jgi:hypothetical protein